MGRRRWSVGFFCALLVGSLLPTAATAGALAPPEPRAVLQAGLLERLADGELDRFVVEFSARADLTNAAATRGWAQRGTKVRDTLVATARRSQARALGVVAATPGARARSHWLTNVLVVDGDASLARRLSRLDEVSAVRAERTFPLVDPVERAAVTPAAEGDTPWGITKIGAENAWADGIIGSGVVVATIDTGVEYGHEALVTQYRGNTGGGTFEHAYNWWDPTGICGDSPCDNDGHGTHTMGTIAGGDGPGPFTPDIGVAPGARWIAAKGCESAFCTEGSLLSSGEFMIAPTDLDGANPDASKRPDIVSNSWGGGPGDEFYSEVVQAWRAAGIVPVFAAGNPGPECGAGGSPGDYAESFSVGATDIDDEIAEFSGRGPSVFEKVNPDVSAPGVDVVSSLPGDSYGSLSGTSMAAPHTAGTLALVLAAEIGLAGAVDTLTDALRSTAIDRIDESCGGADDGDPNNVYGDGRIAADLAVTLVATGGTLAGDVVDVVSSAPIAGADIEASRDGRTFHATTDGAGHFELFLGAGSYTVVASAFGYQSALQSGVDIATDETTTADFFLAPLPQRDITGTVTAAEDGSPVEGAEVRALGTPVAAAVTAADGTYTLTLPIGDYTIRVSAGGCTSSDEQDVTLGLDGLTHDVELARKIDDFGHGCRPLALDWVDAPNDTALLGDEIVGRLSLPFSFPFYGESYSRVYLTDNGYVTFVPPVFNFPDPSPGAIPSPNTPNASVYALWQNLAIDESSSVSYTTVGSAPNRAFVLEFEQLKVGPRFVDDADTDAETSAGRVDFEVKLWENGNVDVLYGDNPANPGDGRGATIGIENADGSDALQFSSFDDLVSANSAFRYEVVPSGVVSGTVTDANDGLPIAGATVTASPGGRTATTDATGAYDLRLRPGTYVLTYSATDYVAHEESGVVVGDGDAITIDVALDAPIAAVTPTELSATVEYGDTALESLTIGNDGSSALDWQLFEREGSRVPPELPPVGTVVREPSWAPAAVPARTRSVQPSALPPDALETIIDDPDDDSDGAVEVTAVRGGSDNAELSMAIDFSADTPMNSPVGFVLFDTDQDPATGFAPQDLFGLPTQDVGADYFADLFGVHDSEPVVGIYDTSFELVALVTPTITDHTLLFSVPLSAFGDDEGTVDVDLVIGDFAAPVDWAPDEGHGTVRTFTDVPWIATEPSSGVLAAGDDVAVDVTLGDPDLAPGTYDGALVLVSDAPTTGAIVIDVQLTVSLPAGWGAAEGTVRDVHTGEPVNGAQVVVNTTSDGAPLELHDTTGSDGVWSVIGPPGTWPTEVAADGYLGETIDVTITSAGTLSGQDAFLHRDQPHAAVGTAPVTAVQLAGRTTTQVRTLSNAEGHRALEFSIGEVALAPPPTGGGEEVAVAPLAAGANLSSRDARSAGRTSPGAAGHVTATGEVVAEWDTGMTLPWGVGYHDSTVTISDPEELLDVEFMPAGERLRELEIPWAAEWAADMAWDPGRGLLWHVNVGGDNALYGIDPSDGSVVATVEGPGWTDISQRGVAYDASTDTFYVGGWNEGIVYHVAGPSGPEPGTTLDSCAPEDPNIAGLAYNPAFQKLWVTTNSELDDIWLVDAATCEAEAVLAHPDPGFNGAGVELDPVGNLWTVSQGSQRAYLIDSGLPTFGDVPWLTVSPGEGTVEPGASTALQLTFDSTGMPAGVYDAMVAVVSNDPSTGVSVIPVRLLVTKYRKLVNVGGSKHVFPDGTGYSADRRFTDGAWGWLGTSTTRSTTRGIAGTTLDAVYRSQREGAFSYRFTVPNGRYLVRLEFAELTAMPEFGRIMDVRAEGALAVNNLDVAGAVGRYRALRRDIEVEVRDGVLGLRFVTAHGKPPILNAIRVVWLPPT